MAVETMAASNVANNANELMKHLNEPGLIPGNSIGRAILVGHGSGRVGIDVTHSAELLAAKPCHLQERELRASRTGRAQTARTVHTINEPWH